MYGELDGTFPNHPADPIQPENQRDLVARVLETGADIGLAFDGDADRVFLVDEQGQGVSGSLTTAIVAAAILEQRAGRHHPATTSSARRRCPRRSARPAGTPIRTRVGHSLIKKVMAETGAAFGGEHSGHYYFRDNYRADSGLITALVVLERMSALGVPLSELRKPFERYAASGEHNTAGRRPRRGHRAGRRGPRRRRPGPARRPHRRPRRLVVQPPSRRTPSRCCGSTSRRPPRRTSIATSPRCSPSSHPTRRDRRPWRHGPRSPTARDPRVPRRQGPAALPGERGHALQPPPPPPVRGRDGIPIMLIDEAETVDDAEHERLMAKVAELGLDAGAARASDRDAGPDRHRRHARSGLRAARADGGGDEGRRPTCRRAARARHHRERRRARHGRQRDRRRRRHRHRRSVHAGAGRSCRRATRRRSSSTSTASCSRSRAPATPRRSSRRPRWPGSTVPASSSSPRAASWPSSPRGGGPCTSRSIPRSRSRAPPSARSTVPVLMVLEQVGLFPGAAGWITEAIDQLRRARDELRDRRSGEPSSPTRSPGRPRSIYGGGSLGEVAALRWKNQCNENAKVPAFCRHGARADPQRDLRLGSEPVAGPLATSGSCSCATTASTRRSAGASTTSARSPARWSAGIEEVWAEGEGALAQLADLVLVGDVVSIELAYQLGRRSRPGRRAGRPQAPPRRSATTDAAGVLPSPSPWADSRGV